MKKNHTRGGFLIIIMIAFSSILLGLATTFFIYCTKSLDSSGEAVRYAQSRIALHGALNYIYKTFNAASDGVALNTIFPLTTKAISFNDPGGNPRAMNMGYARIARVVVGQDIYGGVDPVYKLKYPDLDRLDGMMAQYATPGVPDESPADILFNVTVGCGLYQGSTPTYSPIEVQRIYPLTVNVTRCGTGYSGTQKVIKMTLSAPYASLPTSNW